MVDMLTDAEIRKVLARSREAHGRVFAPLKYFRGLASERQVQIRYKKMLQKNYKPFRTNAGITKTRTSSYTRAFRRKYGSRVKSLRDIARVSGIPLRVLRTVYDRGMAAWRTGHRPGASPQQWAYARVHSYVMKGKTYHTANKNLRTKRKTKP